MAPLPTDLRRLLEKKVIEARDAAEAAAIGALKSLAVDRAEPFPAMSEGDRELRRVLRARARQLGDFREPLAESAGFSLLVQETAYEQWHRMLFARFLAENGLLIHPEHRVPVTLEECAELAPGEGEPDEWMLAARFASEMLPGIFRIEDPVLKIRFAPEGRQALESLLADLPASVFLADDSLGWAYQFWQSKKKKEVNDSERKIGGADLAPVTQLFTEHYMVAFLLENSLGAWWAGKRPDSPLLKEWEYLRYADDGTPAAGTFEGWPSTAAEVTVMDPCCGSGHFLVSAFDMLRKMRQEEEGLSPKEAADAVLRDNLFGLEIDARCVQIAVFALALAAWKVEGYRELPPMNVACSGVPARGTAQEWRQLAGGDSRLADALERLFYLFKDADTLGSLIDPRRAAESDRLTGISYQEVAELLGTALSRYGETDPSHRVFVRAAGDAATAGALLAREYTLVTTNPPFLSRSGQGGALANHAQKLHAAAKHDLATTMLDAWAGRGRAASLVLPHKWLFMSWYKGFRQILLRSHPLLLLAYMGPRAFEAISGEVVDVVLAGLGPTVEVRQDHEYLAIDVSDGKSPEAKARALRSKDPAVLNQLLQLENPDARVLLAAAVLGEVVGVYAEGLAGIQSGDYPRFGRVFWEVRPTDAWARQISTVRSIDPYAGREHLLYWQNGAGDLLHFVRERLGQGKEGAWLRGANLAGKVGVAFSSMTSLPCTIYTGELFDNNTAVVIPHDLSLAPALWAYAESGQWATEVRKIDTSIKVTNQTFVKVPFDIAYWTKVAAEKYPLGLPQPHSDDPTQWLFKGNIVGSEAPLHVAVARLLGYCWPDQEHDELDRYSDPDGIVCLPPVGGERPAADRLLELLAAAHGEAWSQFLLDGLLAAEGASDLATWLRDGFFASHCKLFHHRPFIWHIWDGRKDGFSALVNYHKLDRKLLERLTYSVLQSWIDRQKAEAARGTAGAEARLVGADELKKKLELILKGEPPYDVHVRWKPVSQQSLGWDPDINDGVRLNCRPFVTAGVLRAKFNVKWEKDRGKNPDGTERLNDLHYTIAEKLAARKQGSGG